MGYSSLDVIHFKMKFTTNYVHVVIQLIHANLHWLDLLEQMKYKLVSVVYNCLSSQSS